MSRLFETIKVKNGIFYNIELHNNRFNTTRKNLFGIDEKSDLKEIIRFSGKIINGVSKCKVIYRKFIEDIEFSPYFLRKIKSLKTIEDNDIEYTYKFEDRENINKLFQQKEKCDDILIISRGMVTDTSFCNIVFSDGNQYFTTSTPLLKGTKREQLIRNNIIKEEEIRKNDIPLFKKAILINAMIDMEDKIEIPVDNIY